MNLLRRTLPSLLAALPVAGRQCRRAADLQPALARSEDRGPNPRRRAAYSTTCCSTARSCSQDSAAVHPHRPGHAGTRREGEIRQGAQRRSDARPAGAPEVRANSRALQRTAHRYRRRPRRDLPRLQRRRGLPSGDRAAQGPGEGLRRRRRSSISPADHTVFYPEEESFFSHNERSYLPRKMAAIAPSDAGLAARRGGCGRRQSRDRRIRRGRLPRPVAARHRRQRPDRRISAVSPEGDAGEGSRLQSHAGRRLHRRHQGHAHLSLAPHGHRRKGWRPDHQPAGLAARQAFAGAGHVVDQARQSGVGLVECQQRLRSGFQVRRQHADLQVLHRLRR